MPEKKKKKSRFFKVPEKEEKTEEKGEKEEKKEKKTPQKAKPKAKRKKKKKSDLEQKIYQAEGILKTLDRKLEDEEIDEKTHAERTKKLRQELADLYEKKIKHDLK